MNKTFKDIGLNKTMQEVVEQLYFKKPTSIQAKAIPAILKEESIIGHSQTGSGNRHACPLRSMNNLADDKDLVQLVITARSLEVAMQLHEEVKPITTLAGKEDVWSNRLIIGGIDLVRMIRQVER